MAAGTIPPRPARMPSVTGSLLAPLRYAVRNDGVVLASPAVAFVGGYVAVYGVALAVTWERLGGDAGIVLLAVLAGLLSVAGGTLLAWRRWGGAIAGETGRGPQAPAWMLAYALAITGVGLLALTLYFVRIGDIPLFMQTAEQARVEAAKIGGAPLRVLALFALPGSWLVVAIAARTRRLVPLAAAIGLVLVVAGSWLLTANRAPSFIALEVAAIVALSAWGRLRIPWSLSAVLLGVAIVAVVATGVVGAVRLGSTAAYGPPAPGETIVSRPPPNYPTLVMVAIRSYAQVPVQNLRSTMDAVPERIGWRLGYTYVQPILTALPGHQTTFDADLKEALGQRYRGGGTVPGLLGESYANFGPPGWLIVPGLVAFGLVWLFARSRREDTASAWALYAFAIAITTNATISGLIVASPFPYVATVLLGGPALVETWSRRRRDRPGGVAPASAESEAPALES